MIENHFSIRSLDKSKSLLIHLFPTLTTHQLKFTSPSDTAVELCTGGGMRVEPFLLAHNPGVLNWYGKTWFRQNLDKSEQSPNGPNPTVSRTNIQSREDISLLRRHLIVNGIQKTKGWNLERTTKNRRSWSQNQQQMYVCKFKHSSKNLVQSEREEEEGCPWQGELDQHCWSSHLSLPPHRPLSQTPTRPP